MSGVSVTLVFEACPEAGRSFKLGTPRTVIGRRKGEIIVKDAEISGEHCEITIASDKVTLRDLQSTNGSFVNGKKLAEMALKDGDRLTLGQSKILVKVERSAPPAPAPAPASKPARPASVAPTGPSRADSKGPAPKPANSPMAMTTRAPSLNPTAPIQKPAKVGPAAAPIDGIGALINEELEGFSEATDSAIMDLARADEELKLPYRTNLFFDVIEGPDAGMKVQFPKGNMVIGRLNADVVLKDSDISRRHALVEAYTRDKIFIKDLASTNGTFVNGQRVTYDKLKNGDKVRVGKTILRFRVEEVK